MSWDGTLSSGGVCKHGTPQHTTQGDPGTYAMPFAVTFDSAGAESAAYQAWNATPSYPANTYVLGSDSKLYRAVISNAGNDPTTDDGSHWVRVSIPVGASAEGEVPIWDDTSQEYVPGAVSGTIADGTVNNSTLRWNGTTWVESQFAKNSDSQVTINSPSAPVAGIPLVVKSPAGQVSGIDINAENASDATSYSVRNTAQSSQLNVGICGSTNDYVTGTSQGDGVLRLMKDSKRIWIGSKVNSGDANSTAIAAFDQTGVVIGSTAAAGAKLDVTAASGGVGAIVTGASGQPAAKVAGSGSTFLAPALLVNADSFGGVVVTNSTTPGSASGGGIMLTTTNAPTSSSQSIGILSFRTPSGSAGAYQPAATIQALSAGSHSVGTSPSSLLFLTTAPSSASATERLRVFDVGDVVFNMSGSALATSAIGPFLHLPNMSGTPTGTPITQRTGATPLVYDTLRNTLWAYNSGWVPVDVRVPVAVTPVSNTYTVDASLGKHFRLTLAATNNIAAPTNPIDGQKIILELIQDGSGNRTINSWNAAFVFGTDVPQPTLSTIGGKVDYVGFVYKASVAKWHALAVSRGF